MLLDSLVYFHWFLCQVHHLYTSSLYLYMGVEGILIMYSLCTCVSMYNALIYCLTYTDFCTWNTGIIFSTCTPIFVTCTPIFVTCTPIFATCTPIFVFCTTLTDLCLYSSSERYMCLKFIFSTYKKLKFICCSSPLPFS